MEATQLGISDWRKKIDVLDERLVQLIETSTPVEAPAAVGRFIASLRQHQPSRTPIPTPTLTGAAS